MRPEIGLGFQSDKRSEDYARLAQAAEGHGFDVLSVYSDLMYQPPIFPLLVMAAHTQRVRLGPACLNPYSLAPYEIAGQTAALDLASNGRAYLGLARGTWLAAVGIDQAAPVATIREALEVIRRLLAGDDSGFSGDRFRLDPGTAFRYRPLRPDPPLMIGTWGPRTSALAGELANEVKIGGSANPDMVAVARKHIGVGAEACGRDPEDIRIVMGAVTVVDHDGEAARAKARTEVAMYLAVVAGLDPTFDVPASLLEGVRDLISRGAHEEAGALIPDEVLDRFAFAGTPSQVAEHARALLEAGAGRVEFGTPHGLTDAGGVELLGSEVLPRLRRA